MQKISEGRNEIFQNRDSFDQAEFLAKFRFLTKTNLQFISSYKYTRFSTISILQQITIVKGEQTGSLRIFSSAPNEILILLPNSQYIKIILSLVPNTHTIPRKQAENTPPSPIKQESKIKCLIDFYVVLFQKFVSHIYHECILILIFRLILCKLSFSYLMEQPKYLTNCFS